MHQHIAPIPCRPWALNGLSERLIVSHYENNYDFRGRGGWSLDEG